MDPKFTQLPPCPAGQNPGRLPRSIILNLLPLQGVGIFCSALGLGQKVASKSVLLGVPWMKA